MQEQQGRVDKPEPRWQALLAFLAVGAIYLALPSKLVVGPTWLLPTLIVGLLAPTMVSHRVGRRSLNRVLASTAGLHMLFGTLWALGFALDAWVS